MQPIESVQRFPLAWPLGWPRQRGRKRAAFNETVRVGGGSNGESFKRVRAISMATAVERLEKQIAMLGGKDPTLSTNVKINLRGLPTAT
jgi:hypothetical protein